MNRNVGNVDRLLRAGLGVVLLGLALFSSAPLFDTALVKIGAVVVGLVMLGTAGMRICPLYSLFGIKTCRT